jgi:hypothetical protein
MTYPSHPTPRPDLTSESCGSPAPQRRRTQYLQGTTGRLDQDPLPLPRPGRSHTCPPSRHRPTERLGLGHVQNSSAASGSVPQADHFGPTDPQAWLGPVADAPAHAASEVRSALPAPGRPGDRLIVVQETRSQRSGAVGARLESVGGSGPTPSRRPAR